MTGPAGRPSQGRERKELLLSVPPTRLHVEKQGPGTRFIQEPPSTRLLCLWTKEAARIVRSIRDSVVTSRVEQADAQRRKSQGLRGSVACNFSFQLWFPQHSPGLLPFHCCHPRKPIWQVETLKPLPCHCPWVPYLPYQPHSQTNQAWSPLQTTSRGFCLGKVEGRFQKPRMEAV